MVPGEYDETFAPVARWVSIRVLLAVATQFGFHTQADDVETAFLMATMDTLVYVSIPQGYYHLFPAPRPLLQGEKLVCQLLKSIPGVKQGSRLFWLKFVRDLKTLGYSTSPTDSCILFRSEGQETHIIGLWVDDLIHVFNSQRLLASCRFELKRLGYILVSKPNLEWHLGMRITRSTDNLTTTMDMEALIEKAAVKFGLTDLKPTFTPAPPATFLDKAQSPPEKFVDFPYRSAAATALYVSIVGRAESTYPVNCACRFMDNWNDEHVLYLMHIWRYLYSTRQRKLVFKNCPSPDWKLVGFADSSWADVLVDRTSTMGYAFFIGPSLVAWSSKKQRSVALSSNHAEYVSLGEASREGIFISNLLTDFGHSVACSPFVMASDSNGALALSRHPMSTRRNKHLETALHWIRQAIEQGIFKTVKVDTTVMVADVLTKPLGRVLFQKFANVLMGDTPFKLSELVIQSEPGCQ